MNGRPKVDVRLGGGPSEVFAEKTDLLLDLAARGDYSE